MKKESKEKIKDWRQFELMVSHLEKALKPTHFVFKSPDHLMDFEIGETREVDCSISFQKDGKEEKISIECRKRGGNQDVIWIEQLVTKKAALRLSGTIAVSSHGFSKAAYVKARFHGIVLNTYKEVEANFSTDPINILPIRRTWLMKEFKYEISDQCPEVPESLQEIFNSSMANRSKDVDLIRVIESGQIIKLGQVVETALDSKTDLEEGIKERKFRVEIRKGYATIAGFPDEFELEALVFKVEVEIKTIPLVNLLFGKYENPNEVLVETAKARFDSDGKETELGIIFKTLEIEKGSA
jgi:hypothetical protein